MLQIQNKISLLLKLSLLIILPGLISCDKTAIEFGSEGVEGDPNVTMIDTFTASLSTLQLDSFNTAGTDYLIVGSHTDPQLGYIGARSFFQVTAPSLDLRDCTDCRFDSIDLRLKISSGYMGDTSVPFTVNIYTLTQGMTESGVAVGYNVNRLPVNTSPIATKTFSVIPSRKDELIIRLPNSFGAEIFRMLKTNADTVTDNDRFKTFIKGLCIESSAVNNAIYYFDKAATDSIIRIHYTIAGATPVTKTAYITISSSDKQFNSFTYDKSGKPVAAFTPQTTQLLSSTLTNNTAFLHYNSGIFPKINFTKLYNIKETHPYVQVLKAELEVRPLVGTYGTGSIYNLPPSVELRVTDDYNSITGTALTYNYGTEIYTQNGSLYIDGLYGENTAYTYDVTGFVNTIIAEGTFSKKALIIYPSSSYAISNDQRLLIGSTATGNSVKLKLYTLGL